MRFEKICAKGFGKLKDWESPNIYGNIVVIYGRNESGKSTLFNMVDTLLYGWSPATAKNHPYVPWDSSYAECSAEIAMDDKRYYIGRKLMSRPTGFLNVGDTSIDLGNDILPMVENISRDIYREVYALTSDELNLPSQVLWEKLKEQLLVGRYYSFIRPASEVVKELEDEAKSLWRPDRRGKPKSKLLKEELGELRLELVECEETDRNLYELEEQLRNCEKTLEDLTHEKIELTVYIDWCEKILPIENKEKRLETLLEEVGEGAPFDHIPSDVGERLSNIDDEIEQCSRKLEAKELELEKLDIICEALNDSDIVICSHEDEIEGLVRYYGQMARDIDRKQKLERNMIVIETMLRRDGDELIIGGWKDVYINSLMSIDGAMLRRKVPKYIAIKKDIESRQAKLVALKEEDSSKLDGKKLVPVGILFSILGISGLLLKSNLFKFGGMLFLAIGAMALVFGMAFKGGKNQARDVVSSEEEIKRLDAKLREMQGELYDCVHGIPFASIDEAYMGESIIVDVDRLMRHVESLFSIQEEYDYIDANMTKRVHKVETLMQDCMLESTNSLLENIDVLNTSLKAAENRKYKSEQAQEKARESRHSIEKLRSKLKELKEERMAILSDLEEFEGDSVEKQIADLRRRRTLYQEAQLIERQLEIEKKSLPSNCLDFYNEGYIDGGKVHTKILNFEELAHAKVKRDKLDEKLNSLNAKIGALRSELEYGQATKSIDDIRGEMEAVEEELEYVAYRRDKLMLLKNIIEMADRQFKQEHQPDVLNKAGQYLSIITGGKYERIFIPEEKGDKIAILQSGNPYPIEVSETISRGTQEQIYLAIRLALMDHLDGELSMPAFLDEVFINWDGMRIQNGMELIVNMGRRRQIFIFTCHKWLVELLSANLDIQIIDIN
mgnify:CR=1 FL=1